MIRYNITCIDRGGLRAIIGPAHGRYMRLTREAADVDLSNLLKNNSEERLMSVYGKQAIGTFRVDQFDCWDTGDPKGIYVVADRSHA